MNKSITNLLMLTCLIFAVLSININAAKITKSSVNICSLQQQIKSDNNEYVVYSQSNNLKSFDGVMLNSQLKYGNKKSSLKISARKTVKDFFGNSFLVYEFSPTGYSIMNTLNYDIIEESIISTSPFLGVYDNLYYCPLSGYYQYKNGKYFDLRENSILNEDNITSLKEKSKTIDEYSANYISEDNMKMIYDKNYDKTIYLSSKGSGTGAEGQENTADKEVANSWYFKKNVSQFANTHEYHDSGDCGYIALSLVLVYHELFSCKGYFSYEEASQYINNVEANPNNKQNVPVIENSFIGYLVDLYNTPNQTHFALKTITNNFLDGKDISYENHAPISYTKKGVRSQIDNNNPVIICGKLNGECGGYGNTRIYHDVVIYGYYEDGKYLTHYGWENCSQIILSDYTFTFIYKLENKSVHIHNSYYSYKGIKYCGCGKEVN